MTLTDLFNLATAGWPPEDIEILRRDIKAQPQARPVWIETLKGLIEFEKNVATK